MITEQDVIAILIGINSVIFVVLSIRIFKYLRTYHDYSRRIQNIDDVSNKLQSFNDRLAAALQENIGRGGRNKLEL